MVVELALDIIGEITDLREGEVAERAPIVLKRLRDSHHAVAKLYARGLTDAQVSLQTGYSLSRLSVLKRDPAFGELLLSYQRDNDQVTAEVEARLLMVAMDHIQELHERVLDAPEEIGFDELRKASVDLLDRAGFAPIQRSVNKNLNMNIGERLDAARARTLAKPKGEG